MLIVIGQAVILDRVSRVFLEKSQVISLFFLGKFWGNSSFGETVFTFLLFFKDFP